MTRRELLELAGEALTAPTVPYHEQAVREVVERRCREAGLRCERDRVGNVIVRYRHGVKKPPLVFVAHMDHPGFEATGLRMAEFLGGVPKEYFKGAGVRFCTSAGIVRAKVQRVLPGWPKRKVVKLCKIAEPLRRGDFGMWDLPVFRVRGDRLSATAVDDVVGTVAVMAMLIEVARRRLGAHVWGVFTRAEEVGFHGAATVASSGVIPRDALVISVETSRERAGARIGHGPVVRVGDRTAMFDAQASWFLERVARGRTIRAQRCLMDGGTCEGTAFAGFGYRVGGLCVPLGNYHNVGKRGKIEAEYVSVSDVEGLVELAVAAAEEWKRFDKYAAELRRHVKRIVAAAPRVLREI